MSMQSTRSVCYVYKSLVCCLMLVSAVLGYTGSVTIRTVEGSCLKDQQTVWLTIFVHGIMSIKPHLTTNNFIRFMQDKIKNTHYEKSIACMREDEFFCQNQAMGPLGLHYIDQEAHGEYAEKNRTSLVMAYLFDQMNCFAGTGQTHNRYYTFGWTGLLSPTVRYEDGKKLFEALDKEVQRIKKIMPQVNVKVRVIGYSHGGNVALNVGAAHEREYPCSSLVIDELVLLGTPIQYDTDYLINDPIFKRVYNIYSLSDRVQRLDFFSLHRFFSARVFRARKGFVLPDKLVQIQLKVTRLSSCESTKREHRIKKTSDVGARGVISGKSHLLANVSPGHAELWAFGWTPQHYRRTFPLYPLPIVSIVPFITYNLRNYTHSGIKEKYVIVDIRPEHEFMLIRRRNKKAADYIIPFVSCQQLMTLKRYVFSFKPENYTREEYEKHTQMAIEESRAQYEQMCVPEEKKQRAKRCRIKKRRHRNC